MDRINELKTKYGSAIESMAKQGIQIIDVSLRDNKLYVLAYAPTDAAKNAAWNDIKAIDGSYSDLTCDIRIGTPPDLRQASPQSLAEGLAAAFRSDQTPAFGSMLSNLFSSSDGQQRAGLLNQILGAAGPGVLAGALSGPLANILKGGQTVTAEQAAQISPEAIQHVAENAEKANPSIVDQISGFYSQHPKVIQALGAGALAMVMSHMTRKE
jgi:hypothetical protein